MIDQKDLHDFWEDEEKVTPKARAGADATPAETDTETVNHPRHYNAGSVECIDAIEASLGADGFKDFCVGNAIKYLWRWRHKGGKRDIGKAQWYLNRVMDTLNKEENSHEPR